jgi:hypothetical protein
MCVVLHVKYQKLSDCNETCIFSTDFRKIHKISNSSKIRPVGAELFHADGQTDTKLMVPFRNFANASENWQYTPIPCLMRLVVTNRGQLCRGEGKTVPVETRKAYGGVEEKLNAFLIPLQLNCQLHAPAALTWYPSTRRLNAPHETHQFCIVYSCIWSSFHTHHRWFQFSILTARLTQQQICAQNLENRCHKKWLRREVWINDTPPWNSVRVTHLLLS